jgi:hypothetical protein
MACSKSLARSLMYLEVATQLNASFLLFQLTRINLEMQTVDRELRDELSSESVY